jgi:predicted SprT family Zn-dependent metalloprotease
MVSTTAHGFAAQVFKIVNRAVFDGRLRKVRISWKTNMRRTPGRTLFSRRFGLCRIHLSVELLSNNSDLLLQTLLHEMCHAGVYVIDKLLDNTHGAPWRRWVKKVHERNPRVKITRRLSVI